MKRSQDHPVAAWLFAHVRRFFGSRRGSAAVSFAIATLMLLAMGGLAIDYVSVTRSSRRLQTMVDSAALAAVREMTLRNLSSADAQAIVSTYIAANIPANVPYPITATATIERDGFAVRVCGQQKIETPLGLLQTMSGVSEVTADAVIADALIDAGFEIRVDSAVEKESDVPADARIPLAKGSVGTPAAGRSYVETVAISM